MWYEREDDHMEYSFFYCPHPNDQFDPLVNEIQYIDKHGNIVLYKKNPIFQLALPSIYEQPPLLGKMIVVYGQRPARTQ